MHRWHKLTATVTVLMTMILGIQTTAQAVNFVCAKDLNGDGTVNDQGETASCITPTSGQLCPLGAVSCVSNETCPLDPTAACAGGSCTVAQTCTASTTGSGISYSCPNSSVVTSDQASCNALCNQTATCTTTAPTCPLGNQYPCVDNSGTQQCSSIACVDLDAKPPVTQSINSNVYTNNGATDPAGNCLGQILIFSGRNMECRPSGEQTAFKNCCRDEGKVVQDSTGSAVQGTVNGTVIAGVYNAASAAYTGYSTVIASGGSTAVATDAAVNGAEGQMMVAFDPTSLAISIAIAVVVDYLSQGCSQQDMETGMLNGSGYCYQTGSYCKVSWPIFGCVQTANTYCCFNSKLARIINQQGRPQIKSMPPANSNNCRGFTPTEFQNLDFSKIDLSEYYGDLKTQSLPVVQGNINANITKFNSQLQ